MKKTFLSLLALVGTFASAQYVGVNTSTPQSTLDVTAKNPASSTESQIDGILVARVSKARAEAMGTAVPNSNLIFVDDLTAPATIATTAKVSAKGFYYYDLAQSLWLPVSGNDWHTTGNSGTSVDTNYLGTSDNQALVFKTNSVSSGYISTETLGKKNTALGYASLLNANSTVASSNTAFGYKALNSYISGPEGKEIYGANVALGDGAMGQLQYASFNTAVGSGALGGGTSNSWNNVAVGVAALYNNTASNNTAVGGSAMSSSTTGSGNSALGLGALGGLTTGGANVVIGLTAGGSIKNGSANIIIGTQTDIPGDYSRIINIGNVLNGTGVDNWGVYSSASADMNTYAAKRIGIGITPALPNSTLQVGGSVSAKIRALASGTVADDDYTILVQGDISLPNPDATNTGRIYYLISDTTSNTTITIPNYREGGTTTVSASYGLNNGNGGKGLTVQSTGSAWINIGRY